MKISIGAGLIFIPCPTLIRAYCTLIFAFLYSFIHPLSLWRQGGSYRRILDPIQLNAVKLNLLFNLWVRSCTNSISSKKNFFYKKKQLDLFSLHPYHAQSKTLIFLPFPLKSNWLRFRLVSWVIPSDWLWSKTEIIELQKKSPCCRTNEMSPSTSTYDPIDSNKTNFNHHWDKKLNLSLMNNWSLSAFCLFLRCFGSKMFFAAEGIYKSLSTSLQRAPTMWTSTNDNSEFQKDYIQKNQHNSKTPSEINQ